MLLMEFGLLLAPKPPEQLCTPILLTVFAHHRLAKAPCWANQLLTHPVSHCPQLAVPLGLSANFRCRNELYLVTNV